jgi:AraC-like DNA-binding protein
MQLGLHYNINLPEDLTSILAQDFWMLENIGPAVLSTLCEPVKFAATSWIIMFNGSCRADINLVSYEFSGPTLITIKSNQVLQPTYISPDFNATVIVMSKRFSDNMFMFVNSSPLAGMTLRHPVVSIPHDIVDKFRSFVRDTSDIVADNSNPYGPQALLYHMLDFIYGTAYKCYEPYHGEVITRQGRMSDQFLTLVQQNFRKERFLDFYANKLEVTAKHLSRTVKKQTGFTAVEWIERFVILEAKVLLKSSNLNIQQISDELNFPSQSFFGKYFKKQTGLSPKEFRNQ